MSAKQLEGAEAAKTSERPEHPLPWEPEHVNNKTLTSFSSAKRPFTTALSIQGGVMESRRIAFNPARDPKQRRNPTP